MSEAVKYNPQTAFGNKKLIKKLAEDELEAKIEKIKDNHICHRCDGQGECSHCESTCGLCDGYGYDREEAQAEINKLEQSNN
ncbi:MAG: hypothetical protein KAS32_05930 [Candidatus Peribacteraceae bacterium]|nr:hypothetical protein [Candidatus Peribacteraceae bacterium]